MLIVPRSRWPSRRTAKSVTPRASETGGIQSSTSADNIISGGAAVALSSRHCSAQASPAHAKQSLRRPAHQRPDVGIQRPRKGSLEGVYPPGGCRTTKPFPDANLLSLRTQSCRGCSITTSDVPVTIEPCCTGEDGNAGIPPVGRAAAEPPHPAAIIPAQTRAPTPRGWQLRC